MSDVIQSEHIFAVLSVTLNHLFQLKMVLMLLFKLRGFHGGLDSNQPVISICILFDNLLDVRNSRANVERSSFSLTVANAVLAASGKCHKILQLLHILQGRSIFL